MLNNKFIKSIAIISTIGLVISGCGNSSSNDSSVSGYNGKLVDSAIDGISWACGDKSGLTKNGGAFGACPFGTKVTFSVGNIVLGSVGATNDFIFTINDVVGVSREDTTNDTVKNIASLLQSLDSDPDHTNGIVITPEVIKALNSTGVVDLKELTEDKIKEITVATGTTFIDANTALINLKSTLDDVKAGLITRPTQPTDASTN